MADPILNADPSADLFFPLASQPDIVRASQKDEYYKRVLYDKYYEIVQRIMGTLELRSCLKLRSRFSCLFNFTYYYLYYT